MILIQINVHLAEEQAEVSFYDTNVHLAKEQAEVSIHDTYSNQRPSC
jgi:hypothetical protein